MIRLIASFVFVLTLVSQTLAVNYTATLLSPPGEFPSSTGEGISGNIQVGWASGIYSSGNPHAVLWNGTSESVVDLNPGSSVGGHAYAVSGANQVGDAGGHATLWSGTAASAVDLNPYGFQGSSARGVSGNSEVGWAYGQNIGGANHAMLWHGTDAGGIDLNPLGFLGNSLAYAVSGANQVGVVGNHASLWSGTAASFVDLNPVGYSSSEARGVSGGDQVGFGRIQPADDHALLWHGTAESFVDLNPAGYSTTQAYGISGGSQVGYGSDTIPGEQGNHALLWSGTAGSVVDLHQFLIGLPVKLTSSSAQSINSDGSIVGYGLADKGTSYAILWTPGGVGPGDYNRNGVVDAADYTVWRDEVGNVVPPCSGADANCNGFVENSEYQVWKNNFGNHAGSGSLGTSTVPEPTSIVLAGLAILGSITRGLLR
jgi:hypothetical protein